MLIFEPVELGMIIAVAFIAGIILGLKFPG
jgi:hypothetical protein